MRNIREIFQNNTLENQDCKIKLAFISGLKEVVLKELGTIPGCSVLEVYSDEIYIAYPEDFRPILGLKSVTNASLFIEGEKFNPLYVFNHKSILDDMVEIVKGLNSEKPKTFKIICAGSDSTEVRGIAKYISDKYKLEEGEESDLKIYIIKSGSVWQVGVFLTYRPLTVRLYRDANIPGAMNPTIAYAVNSLCNLEGKESYLNPFCGSGTLLIEAGLIYHNLKNVVGFDNDKKALTASIRNLKEAKLIEKVKIVEADLLENPDLGKFDVIASDIPFGMAILKDGNLEFLYDKFVEYCLNHLNGNGVLAVYTSEHELFKSVISKYGFELTNEIQLKFMTNSNSNIYPKVLVYGLR